MGRLCHEHGIIHVFSLLSYGAHHLITTCFDSGQFGTIEPGLALSRCFLGVGGSFA